MLVKTVAFLARVGIVISELISEAVLLGILLALVLAPRTFNATALWVAPLPVTLVLYLHGYYLTRPILGLLWGGRRVGLYSLTASALFAIHMLIGYLRLRPDMKQVSQWTVLAFFAGGTTIVFVCALIGHHWLARKSRIVLGPR